MTQQKIRVASIGECMIEMQCKPDGSITQAFGGDTFNTAAYMARLGAGLGSFVSYVTAIGDDPFSDQMAAFWNEQGVDDHLVLRLKGRRAGLYFIRTDAAGERRFFYWRGEAAARETFESDGSKDLLEALGSYTSVYLSGISLAVLKPESRERLLVRLEELARAGVAVDFDGNYRPLLWGGIEAARAAYERVIGFSTRVLVTIEELEVLGLAPTVQAGIDYFAKMPQLEVVIKDGPGDATLIHSGKVEIVPATKVGKVVDTTAAGDSFSATYILGRLLELLPAEAAGRAHIVAGAVVQHHGAIIPEGATPDVFSNEIAARGQQKSADE
ncbi:sugar kinase [Neorhizobium sp. JUb45]|uniref:sugar kinase n=1 Tax=unclassified Neorhizobium TaxID=2629175 RepID=UPI001051AE1A|nr:sugar kinase [Neorhizobium sp. JUb45]TCR03237.1 2-keto-3-deoxygluconate kinase [Neorhizobium sp. JUb45]